METASFDEIADEFNARVARIVWCTVATVDLKGRPRTRILHPIWEGSTGWIGTSRNSHKAKHLAKNAHVSLSYWDQQHQQIYADCKAEWVDDPSAKQRIWDLYKSTPPPLGYDPAIIPPWSGGPNGGEFGVLKLTPWRIELSALLPPGQASIVWRAKK
ncbi:MAG: pyridoxamine 5'-phosphate oxidase family protein [Dehalococcoidia bacterium]